MSAKSEVANVLAAHNTFHRHVPEFRATSTVRWRCSCGDDIDDDPSGFDIGVRHRAHVADALAEAGVLADEAHAKCGCLHPKVAGCDHDDAPEPWQHATRRASDVTREELAETVDRADDRWQHGIRMVSRGVLSIINNALVSVHDDKSEKIKNLEAKVKLLQEVIDGTNEM